MLMPLSLNTVKELIEIGLADIVRDSLSKEAESTRNLADHWVAEQVAKQQALDLFDLQLETAKREMSPPIAVNAASDRMRRGEADRLVEKCLKESNGSGIRVSEVMKQTGTKYTSAYRALQKLKRAKKAREEDSRWYYRRFTEDGVEITAAPRHRAQ